MGLPLFAVKHLCGSSRLVVMLVVAMVAASGCTIRSSALAPSSGPRQLSGTINSITGARIAGAFITVLSGSNKDVQVTTDAEGRFVFANLDEGTFDLLIEATGFKSITPRVDLFRDIDVNFALSAAP